MAIFHEDLHPEGIQFPFTFFKLKSRSGNLVTIWDLRFSASTLSYSFTWHRVVLVCGLENVTIYATLHFIIPGDISF
jgi:hypothetical protein